MYIYIYMYQENKTFEQSANDYINYLKLKSDVERQLIELSRDALNNQSGVKNLPIAFSTPLISDTNSIDYQNNIIFQNKAVELMNKSSSPTSSEYVLSKLTPEENKI